MSVPLADSIIIPADVVALRVGDNIIFIQRSRFAVAPVYGTNPDKFWSPVFAQDVFHRTTNCASVT
jgi:hypothetical protein